jgi:hypothetical protein
LGKGGGGGAAPHLAVQALAVEGAVARAHGDGAVAANVPGLALARVVPPVAHHRRQDARALLKGALVAEGTGGGETVNTTANTKRKLIQKCALPVTGAHFGAWVRILRTTLSPGAAHRVEKTTGLRRELQRKPPVRASHPSARPPPPHTHTHTHNSPQPHTTRTRSRSSPEGRPSRTRPPRTGSGSCTCPGPRWGPESTPRGRCTRRGRMAGRGPRTVAGCQSTGPEPGTWGLPRGAAGTTRGE